MVVTKINSLVRFKNGVVYFVDENGRRWGGIFHAVQIERYRIIIATVMNDDGCYVHDGVHSDKKSESHAVMITQEDIEDEGTYEFEIMDKWKDFNGSDLDDNLCSFYVYENKWERNPDKEDN